MLVNIYIWLDNKYTGTKTYNKMLQVIRIIRYDEGWQNALISCTIFPSEMQ
jgi:hypothetical protein